MEENKYLNLYGLTLYNDLIKAFINSQIFIGTYEQYEIAYVNGQVPINALVILTDDNTSGGGGGIPETPDNPDTPPATTAVLGYATLGQMILG